MYLQSDPSTPVATYKNNGQFTVVLVNNAGHMVPTDQPAVSTLMVQNFINN